MFVSCGFEELYGAGGFAQNHDIALLGDQFEGDAIPFGVERVTELFDAASYRWPPVANLTSGEGIVNDSLEGWYAQHSSRRSPPSILVRIERGYVLDSIVQCGPLQRPRTIYETHRLPDRAVIAPPPPERLADACRTRFDSERDYLHLNVAGAFNYGHWLVDDLPRIKAVQCIAALGSGRRLCILVPDHGSAMNAVRAQSLRYFLSQSVDIEFFDPNIIYEVPNLFLATPVSFHPVDKSSSALTYLAHAYAARRPRRRRSYCPQKLFVIRRPEHGRTIANLEALRSSILAAGFAIIDPSLLSFARQAELFASAREIVGIMGAAMTNSLFSTPATRLTYLAPEGWIEPFYVDLAGVRGHSYEIVYGTPIDVDKPSHFSSFTISVDDLRAALHGTATHDQP